MPDIAIIGLTKIVHDQSAKNVELIVEANVAHREARQAAQVSEAEAHSQRQKAQRAIHAAHSHAQGLEARHLEQLLALDAAAVKREEEIKLRDELILDWMRSNESFKRLAKKYAKGQGVSDEQFESDFEQEQKFVDEENPQLKKQAPAPAAPVATMGDSMEELRRIKKAEQERRAQALKS